MVPANPRSEATRESTRGLPGVPLAVLLTGLLALAAALAATVVVVPAAHASNTTLCVGYKGCREAGMGNAGYTRNSGTMYWRMYAGHNCTNYAAYRMVRSGLPDKRPWEGSGNAENWGRAMSDITDQKPRVGAIAWWKADVPGGGSVGHLAYVEEVVSEDEIIVSQDSWGGDFSWSRITTSGTGWPSGFIHFNDVPLLNTAAPTVSGEPKVGETLTASGGTWRPGDPDLSFRWKADGQRIRGARSASYTVAREDQGKRLSVKVVARESGYDRERAASAPTEPVLPGELRATSAPTVAGAPVVDGTLTVSPAAWNVAPDSVSYQWLVDGEPVRGATGTAFRPTADHVGARVRVVATARRDGYSPASSSSTATTPVAKGRFTRSTAPAISGAPRPGETLTVDPGTVTPEGRVHVQWLRDGAPVDGATATSYAVRATDLGSRFSARVTHAREGYETATATTGSTRRVRAQTSMRLRERVRRHRVRLVARVTSAVVDPVEGEVKVRDGRETLGSHPLTDGRLRLVLRDLEAGRHRFVLRYRPTPTTTSAREVVRVRVPRRHR